MAGPQSRAVRRAIVWTSPFAALWAGGTFIAAQFPILVDPNASADRPTKWLVLGAVLTWEMQVLCELALAIVQGDDYGRMGPLTFLIDLEATQTMSRINNVPPYMVNGCLFAFLLAAFPLVLLLTTTITVASLWMVTLGASAAFHIRNAGRRFIAWRDSGRTRH